jgi:hypothetical protein
MSVFVSKPLIERHSLLGRRRASKADSVLILTATASRRRNMGAPNPLKLAHFNNGHSLSWIGRNA